MSFPGALGKQPRIPQRHRQTHSQVLGIYPYPAPDFLTWDQEQLISFLALRGLIPSDMVT